MNKIVFWTIQLFHKQGGDLRTLLRVKGNLDFMIIVDLLSNANISVDNGVITFDSSTIALRGDIHNPYLISIKRYVNDTFNIVDMHERLSDYTPISNIYTAPADFDVLIRTLFRGTHRIHIGRDFKNIAQNNNRNAYNEFCTLVGEINDFYRN